MRLFLAPMEGVVDHHFREIYSQIGGIDYCVTEFIRVNELPQPAKSLLRSCPELLTNSQTASGLPVRLQLLGSNPETLAETAQTAAKHGACGIDLNFGCPAKTVNNSKGGAVLLKEPELIFKIVHSVRAAVPKNIPVTAKIRLGFEDRSLYQDTAVAVADAGAAELFVHARSRADGYKPPAYWTYIAHINELVNIPVIANGEIWSVDDWRRCKQQSGSDDFMIGRGLLACPDLALQIRAAATGKEHVPLTWPEVCQRIYQFYLDTKDRYPQRHLGNRAKQWLFYLQMHYPEAEPFFEQIKRYKEQHQFNLAFAEQGCELSSLAETA